MMSNLHSHQSDLSGRVSIWIFVCALSVVASSQAQTTYLWNDTSSNWTSTSSWTPAGPSNWIDPQRLADTIVSFGSQASIANQPNLGGNDVFVNGVSMNSSQSAWNIAGTGVLNVSSGGITVTGTGNNTSSISAPVQITTNATWSIGTSSRLQLTNTLSGTGSMTKSGEGTLLLSGASTNTGDITVTEGILIVSGDRSAATGSIIANGGVIQFGEDARIGGDVTFQARQGGTAAAQTNAPSIFGDSPEEVEVMGDMYVDDEAILDFKIFGSLPDIGYDRFNIGGDVNLLEGELKIRAANLVTHVGDIYFIINNEGSNPISGAFINAPEGSFIFSNGYAFRITYFADTETNSATGGNDIALISVPEIPGILLLMHFGVIIGTAHLMNRRAPTAQVIRS